MTTRVRINFKEKLKYKSLLLNFMKASPGKTKPIFNFKFTSAFLAFVFYPSSIGESVYK